MTSTQPNAHEILQQQMDELNQIQQLTEEDLVKFFTCKVEDVLTQAPPDRPDDPPPAMITVNGTTYIWADTHYRRIAPSELQRRVLQIAKTTLLPVNPKDSSDTRMHHPFLKPRFIEEGIRWLQMVTARDPEEVNPSSMINCRNGVLRITWEGDQVKTTLETHDPTRHLFLDPPGLKYKPDADRTYANTLLECVSDKGRRLLLQQLAASLDIESIRKRGHRVPALLLIGTGQNGKDTLGDIIAQLHGRQSLALISIKDWQSYESGAGRGRFSISQLGTARLSIASENSGSFKIDKLEDLKKAISGEPLFVERKGEDGAHIIPRAAFLFFLNEPPLLDGGGAAILSRYGVIKMPHTYAPNPTGTQRKADPRFKHDPEFIATEVLPGLLNILLEELERIPTDGFDLAGAADEMQALREDTSHLHQFLNECGYNVNPRGCVSVKDAWDDLQQWYKDNDWMIQDRMGEWKFIETKDSDEPVRASRLLAKRLKRLHPDLEIDRHDPSDRRRMIFGLMRGPWSGSVAAEAESESPQANPESPQANPESPQANPVDDLPF